MDTPDRGQYFAPGMKPSATCAAANTNGAVVVNVADTLPHATGAGTPNSYGFVRFRTKVK